MTKKLLLAAGAVAALAFAGGATAGTLTTPTAARVIASEVAIPNGGLTGTISAATTLDNSIDVNTTSTYSVTFKLTGATFDGTPTIAAQGTNVSATGTTYLQADGSALSVITITGAPTAELTGFSVSGAVKVPAKANVSVQSSTSVVVGGTTTLLDTVAATKVVEFKPLLAGFETNARTVQAELPDYTSFTSGTSATLATGINVKVNDGTFYGNLNGTTAITAATIISDLTATVSGPAGAQLDVLESTVGTAAAEEGATDTTAVYDLAPADVANVLGEDGVDFVISNPEEATLNGVAYSIKLAPTYATGYAAAADFGPYAAGEVTLEGTNFIAPWFTLNNPNNAATLRLANQGSTPTGPVFVTLKAATGGAVASNGRVQISSGIAAGSTLEISGPTLAAALGTTAANGDLQVTVQGDGSVISGKVRVRNVSGATFEQSLGNLNDNRFPF